MLNLQTEDMCQTCNGTGRAQKNPCPSCRGAGTLPRIRQLEVKIPPGVRTGSRVRIAGQGTAGHSGPSGNLYLLISEIQHTNFERQEDDLLTILPLPLTVAMLGGKIEVPALNGKLELRVPPETQNGRVFRLSGQGMPRLGKEGRGDLLVRANIVLPLNLSSEEKDLFSRLRDLRTGQK